MLIAPKDSKIDNVTIGPGFDLAKLAGDGKIATGDVKAVPVGKYAKAALEKLGAWQAAEPKFAMAESVRAALTLVARGEAALGIVYSTDAKVEPGVKIVGTFPADSHPPIIYPVAATATAKPEAADYLAFLRSAAAKTILEKYGFTFPDPPDLPDTACSISRPRNGRRSSFRCGSPRSRRWWRRRSGSRVAWLLARRDFWGKSLLDAVIHLPLVLPPVVTGYLLLLTFGRRGLVGALARRPSRHRVRLPLDRRGAGLRRDVVSAAGAADPAVDRGGGPPAGAGGGTLGAAPWRVFLTVTLPLALPGVLAGMVLGFAKAIGEFGATITFVSNIPGETQTISSAIYSLIQTPDGDSRRAAAGGGFRRHRGGRPDRFRMVRAARDQRLHGN